LPSTKTYITLTLGVLLFSSSASADTGLRILIDRCNDIDADEITQMVAVDFLEANEGKSAISISCEGQVAVLRLLEAGTTEERSRSVDLTDIDPVARSRTLALLVVELLEAWQPDSKPAPVPAPEVKARPLAVPTEVKTTDAAPRVVARHGLRQPAFEIGIAFGIGSRGFDYNVPSGLPNVKNIRPYDSTIALMSRLSAQVYPFSKTPAARGLGLSGRYDAIHNAKSSTSDMVELRTQASSWDFNLRYQQITSFAKFGADLGLGNERFKFASDSPNVGTLLDEVPGINIRYTRLAVDADVPLSPKIGVVVNLEYRIVGDVGDLADDFDETQVTAWAGRWGAHYWIKSDLRAQLVYSRATYDYTFVDANGVTQATGDDFISSFVFGLSLQR
jgi:hypothetical protein